MVKYHINNEGKKTVCKATTRACQFTHVPASPINADMKTVDDVFTVVDSRTPQLKPGYDINTIAPEWVGKVPSYPDGTTFEAAWVDAVKPLQEWEQKNGELTEEKTQEENNLMSLITDLPEPARPRGAWVETAEAILEDTGFDVGNAPGEQFLTLHTRLGGGNRECWCDDYNNHTCYIENIEELESHPNFIGSKDDDYDQTYANYYYRIDKTPEEVEEHQQNILHVNSLMNLKRRIEAVKNKQMTPWAAISANPGSYTPENLKHAKENLQEAKKKQQNITAVLKKLKNGQYDEKTNPLRLQKWDIQRIKDNHQKLEEKTRELRTAEKTKEEAEQLPDGELKTYLLGDRGTSSYVTTEKQGRRNVKVKKTFQKGSLLGKQLEDAKRSHKLAEGYFKDVYKKASESHAAVSPKQTFERAEKTVEETKQQRVATWGAGWPDPKKPLPPIPKTY